MTLDPADLPLKDVRVLDLCVGTGELTSRYLADLGADVVRLEPSATGRSRGETDDAFFRATHSANKRSLSLDLRTDADLEVFWALAERSDIVVEGSRPSEHADNPVAPRLIRARLPHLVVVSLTQFGQSGPYRDWEGGDAVHYALSGVLSRSGLPGTPPVLPPVGLASESAAIQAAWCALVAHLNRLDTGRGDHVDASVLECTMQALDPGWGMGGSATGGVPAANGPRGRPDARHLYPIFPCLDGSVRICILAPRQWEGMLAWLGRPAEFADPELASLATRFAAAGRIYPAIARMFATRTRATITAEGEQYGVPTAALLSCSEVLSADHFRDRNVFTYAEVVGARASLVNGMVEIDGQRAGIRTAAPTPGTDTAELRAEAAVSAHQALRARQTHDDPARKDAGGRLPLEGIRVLDLGVIVMGAELGRLLADMGAEVIKVENRAFPDGGRQSMTGDAMTASFAWGHRNKSGLGLSLRTPEGVALFKQLAAVSDVVLSNFKPGTLESLGLGYDVLSEINPGIVMADSSAFGSTGPWSRRMGYGPLVRAETGVTQRWADPEVDGSWSDASTIYPDHIAARVGAVAVLALLLRRRRTGRGGNVSVAQAEVILGQIAVDLARESVHPGSIRAVGNDLSGDAPRGVFRCAGDDEWVVVDVHTDRHFDALATAMRRPELAPDPRFATSAAREQHRTELNDVLTRWTAERSPRQAADALQRAGVPAAPMNRVNDLLTDPHVVDRGFFRTVRHPHVAEPMSHEGHPARFEGIADVPLAPAPLPGEHSRRILAVVLGLDDERIEKLVRAGVVEEPTHERLGTTTNTTTNQEPRMPRLNLDPRTPVIVGVGQSSERLGDPGYARRSPVDLAADAAGDALRDAGAETATEIAAVAAAIDTVAGVRQFENSVPRARAPLGRSDNFPRSVASRLGAAPRRAILDVSGGQSPQHLVNELGATIAAGGAEVALLVGAEAISTASALAEADDRPDWSEHVEGDLEDRGYGLAGLTSMELTAHGLTGGPALYAVLENARRARLGQSRADYAASMGKLFEPFTRVAAKNPHASAPVERNAVDLVAPTEANRMIADPFTRYVVAREKVNQGAAVLIMSIDAARRLGVPEDRWVFLHGHADTREKGLLDRPDLGATPAHVAAARHALDVAGISADDVATFDLYSCFPIAVSAVIDGLGIAADDPRGLTLTGGLPFFGGAGNNYSMHGIAETVQRARTAPGSYGFVGANGGTLSKYSVGVYSTTPAEWRPDDSAAVQAKLDAVPDVPRPEQADGWGIVETFTVKHDRSGSRTGIVVGRLEATGERFLALTPDGDDETLGVLEGEQPCGQWVFVRSFGFGNRVTTTPERMAALFPARPKVLRDDYQHVIVRRDGHLLEVTINRPEARNSLHPMANDELDEIFDAYFDDPDLWVAILTGAGTQAFCAGNDLVYSASGKPMWVPQNGFAGLTSRPNMTKPVVAAVNGYAMGGGCEIALACHLIVADETAQFALSEVAVGLVAGAGGVIRLPRTIPPKVATEMILTGRRIGAGEAVDRGLVNQVTPPGEALDGARALAARILAGSPTSVRISLGLMAEAAGVPDAVDAVRRRSRLVDELLATEDAVEGVTAFAQKRLPVWRNR